MCNQHAKTICEQILEDLLVRDRGFQHVPEGNVSVLPLIPDNPEVPSVPLEEKPTKEGELVFPIGKRVGRVDGRPVPRIPHDFMAGV